MRAKIIGFINKYEGPKYVGTVEMKNYRQRYGLVNEEYYKVLKHSKIIVTANPAKWEGDFRLWEALLTGNLVLCDVMYMNEMMKYPLVDKKHIVFYHKPIITCL